MVKGHIVFDLSRSYAEVEDISFLFLVKNYPTIFLIRTFVYI